MKRRCENPRSHAYGDYGGRGIKVCDRWKTFENFISDMGERPEGMTLERIDVNGNYTPENCRWATTLEQNGNRRTRRLLTLRGKTQSMTEWARETGIDVNVINARLRRGWSDEKTLTTPVEPRRPRTAKR
jgi:hypothetical protein